MIKSDTHRFQKSTKQEYINQVDRVRGNATILTESISACVQEFQKAREEMFKTAENLAEIELNRN